MRMLCNNRAPHGRLNKLLSNVQSTKEQEMQDSAIELMKNDGSLNSSISSTVVQLTSKGVKFENTTRLFCAQ